MLDNSIMKTIPMVNEIVTIGILNDLHMAIKVLFQYYWEPMVIQNTFDKSYRKFHRV